jgi:DNA polymerase-3 subunit alpha
MKNILRKISIENLNKYLSNNLELNIKEYFVRLNFELEVITSKKLQDYLLIIADIINYGKDNGILIGPGRGSSGGSLVCMCLGITNIDPIKYNLLFERFISISRPTTPDVIIK